MKQEGEHDETVGNLFHPSLKRMLRRLLPQLDCHPTELAVMLGKANGITQPVS